MPNDEVCLNCKVLEQNERKVPIWQKMEGNDSLLPLIIRLDKYNPKNSILKQEFPKLTDLSTKVLMESNKRNRWVFYWAANRSKDPSHIMSERDAYGSNTNHGILETDGDGNAEFVLNCPQPYINDSKITYPRHVHYTFLTEEDTWNENINSLVVLCHLDFKQMAKFVDDKSHMIIYVSKEKETDIPNSIVFDYTQLIEMNRTERKHYLLRFINRNIDKFPKINTKVESKKLKLRDIPIIVYGKNKTDKSSLKLSEYLIDANIVNVIEYSEGLEGWNKNMNDTDDIDDKDKDTDDPDIDDMKMVKYEGKEYYIHDGIDVSDTDYKLVGKWDPEKNMILWYSKPDDSKPNDSKPDDSKPDNSKQDNSKQDNSKPDKDKDVKKDGEINIEDRYKEKLVVNKLDGDDDTDRDDNEYDSDDIPIMGDKDDVVDNLDDKIFDDLFDNTSDTDRDDIRGGKNSDNYNEDDEDNDDNDKLEKIKQIERHNDKDTKDAKIMPKNKSISVLNRKYKNRGITFF
tara:strand:- start:5090 stop:6631 length:1542 start_codon:yes stop_codon:yes gene_type:complete